MKRIATQVALLLLTVVVGCMTMYDFDVEIVSDPPGARIEVSNEYIGDAPITIQMRGWGNWKLLVAKHENSEADVNVKIKHEQGKP